MKDLPQLKENQYILLQYIKEVAREQIKTEKFNPNGSEGVGDMEYAVYGLINLMIDAYKYRWELE
tara:strand:- start:82 stop:276 length:195 start_codon:yes stop_codon:yes gene_type:complete